MSGGLQALDMYYCISGQSLVPMLQLLATNKIIEVSTNDLFCLFIIDNRGHSQRYRQLNTIIKIALYIPFSCFHA